MGRSPKVPMIPRLVTWNTLPSAAYRLSVPNSRGLALSVFHGAASHFPVAMDSLQAPLIASDPRDNDNELEYDADDATDTASIASRQPDARPGLFVILLTFAAGISGLLFGCKLADLTTVIAGNT